MQDLANISENTGIQRGKKAEFSGHSCPGVLTIWANWVLVASGGERDRRFRSCRNSPKMERVPEKLHEQAQGHTRGPGTLMPRLGLRDRRTRHAPGHLANQISHLHPRPLRSLTGNFQDKLQYTVRKNYITKQSTINKNQQKEIPTRLINQLCSNCRKGSLGISAEKRK